MSIATKRGDGGQTSLVGGIRVSKSSPRVECYGTIDELISQMGFARSICQDAEICERVKAIQRELYKVGSAIATPPEPRNSMTRPSEPSGNRSHGSSAPATREAIVIQASNPRSDGFVIPGMSVSPRGWRSTQQAATPPRLRTVRFTDLLERVMPQNKVTQRGQ